MNNAETKKTALKVSYIIIACNAFLTALKIMAGILGHSQAMITDGINSASDVISTLVVIIGVTIANKQSDKAHQYGHERLECVASIVLSVLLLGTGVLIGYDGVMSIITGEYKNLAAPNTLALSIGIVSIAIKTGMFVFAFVSAKKLKSVILKADSMNHLSDIISSTGTLIGIIFAMHGFPVADVIASLIICLFIVKLAIDVFREATDKMIDKSCDETTISKMERIILGVDGVMKIDDIKTRMFGNKIYVDVEIGVLGDLPLNDAHVIAENAHDAIEALDERVKHCMVHVNPVGADGSEPPQKDVANLRQDDGRATQSDDKSGR